MKINKGIGQRARTDRRAVHPDRVGGSRNQLDLEPIVVTRQPKIADDRLSYGNTTLSGNRVPNVSRGAGHCPGDGEVERALVGIVAGEADLTSARARSRGVHPHLERVVCTGGQRRQQPVDQGEARRQRRIRQGQGGVAIVAHSEGPRHPGAANRNAAEVGMIGADRRRVPIDNAHRIAQNRNLGRRGRRRRHGQPDAAGGVVALVGLGDGIGVVGHRADVIVASSPPGGVEGGGLGPAGTGQQGRVRGGAYRHVAGSYGAVGRPVDACGRGRGAVGSPVAETVSECEGLASGDAGGTQGRRLRARVGVPHVKVWHHHLQYIHEKLLRGLPKLFTGSSRLEAWLTPRVQV